MSNEQTDPLDKYPDLKYHVETYANYPLANEALDAFALSCFELGMKRAADKNYGSEIVGLSNDLGFIGVKVSVDDVFHWRPSQRIAVRNWIKDRSLPTPYVLQG